MQVNKRELGPCRVALDIEVEAERFQAAAEKVTDEYLKHVSVPGFRKGRAPRQLALRYVNWDLVNRHAAYRVIDAVVDEVVYANEDLELYRPVDPDEDITDVQYPEGGQPLRFTVLVTTRPKVELGPYKGLRFEYAPIEVTEQDVDNAVEKLLARHAELKDVERPVERGDWVVLRSKEEDDPAEERMLIADPLLSPHGDSLIGLQVGDEVTLPFSGENDAGETCVVARVRSWVAPELTDEVAQKVGGYASADDMRASVRRSLEERAARIAESELEDKILETVAASSTVVMPDELVEKATADRTASIVRALEEEGTNLNSYLMRTQRSIFDFQQEVRERSERALKTYLVLHAIAEAEGLSYAEDEGEEPAEDAEGEGSGKDRDPLTNAVLAFLKANNEIVNVAAGGVGESE